MGECNYFFKAQFANNKEALKAHKSLVAFLKQAVKANEFYSPKQQDNGTTGFWAKFEQKFPLIAEYVKFIGHWGGEAHNLSGLLDLGDPNETWVVEDVLCHIGVDVWHFADWVPFRKYFVEKFKPIKAVEGNEENGCANIVSLHLYEWEEIVKEILKQKSVLPMLMGIHPQLDELLAFKMK